MRLNCSRSKSWDCAPTQTAQSSGHLHRVIHETPHEETGENEVQLDLDLGKVSADLTAGANVAATQPLKANDGLSSPGVKLHGSGFIITPDEAKALGLGKVKDLEKDVRPYRNGRTSRIVRAA